MKMRKVVKTLLANLARGPRAELLERVILTGDRSVLDVGCRDLYFTDRLRSRGYAVVPADLEPSHEGIQRLDIQQMAFEDGAFDIVLALEVLEHVGDPVRAMKELRRVAKRQLIVSVPNEPWFSFWRFNTWEREHLWAVAWPALHYHLGKPDIERTLVLGRYRFFVWNV